MDVATARASLEAERARLLEVRGAAQSLTGEDGTTNNSPEQHGAEQATETLEREIDSSVLQRSESELEEVEAALARLEEGAYGICEVCKKPIPDERLEAQPAARYCIEDQGRIEREPWLRSGT